MIKGFMTKSALLDYINHELYYGRNKFVFELIDNINYLTSKYQEYKAKVYKALYDKFDDDKYGILFISRIAEEALKPTEVKPLDIHDRDSEYTNEEIILLIKSFDKLSSINEFNKILNPLTVLTKSGLEILVILRNSMQPIFKVSSIFAIAAID